MNNQTTREDSEIDNGVISKDLVELAADTSADISSNTQAPLSTDDTHLIALEESSIHDGDSDKPSVVNTPFSTIFSTGSPSQSRGSVHTAASFELPEAVAPIFNPIHNHLSANTPITGAPAINPPPPAFHRTLSDMLQRHLESNTDTALSASPSRRPSAVASPDFLLHDAATSPVQSSIATDSEVGEYNYAETLAAEDTDSLPDPRTSPCVALSCRVSPSNAGHEAYVSLPKPHDPNSETSFPNKYSLTAPYQKVMYIPTCVPASQPPKTPAKAKHMQRWGPKDLWGVTEFLWYRGYLGEHPLALQQNQLIELSGHKDRSTIAKHEERLLGILFCPTHNRAYIDARNAHATYGRKNTFVAPEGWMPPISIWQNLVPEDWNREKAVQVKAYLEGIMASWREDLRIELRLGEPEDASTAGKVRQPFNMHSES